MRPGKGAGNGSGFGYVGHKRLRAEVGQGLQAIVRSANRPDFLSLSQQSLGHYAPGIAGCSNNNLHKTPPQR